MKASVREGRLKLVVRDATGRVRQEALLGPSRPNNYEVETGEEVSAAGAWAVEFETKDAVGSYEFTFTQNDE